MDADSLSTRLAGLVAQMEQIMDRNTRRMEFASERLPAQGLQGVLHPVESRVYEMGYHLLGAQNSDLGSLIDRVKQLQAHLDEPGKGLDGEQRTQGEGIERDHEQEMG